MWKTKRSLEEPADSAGCSKRQEVVVCYKYLAVVFTLVWGMSAVTGCRAGLPTAQPNYRPRDSQPGEVEEEPDGSEAEPDTTGHDQTAEENEEVIPVGEGPTNADDPGWRHPEPDPAWEDPPEAPGIYLRGFYSRRHQRLVVVADHETGSDLTVTLGYPAGVSADLPAENVIPDGRGALEFRLAIDPLVPDFGEIAIAGKDADGWRVNTDVEYTRALYIDQTYYDIENRRLTVEVDAMPNCDYELLLEPPAGIMIEDQALRERTGCAAFAFAIAIDPGEPERWDIKTTLTSVLGHQDIEQAGLWRLPLEFPANSLNAYPLRTTARAGNPVRIVVASGPSTDPFQYLNGAGVVVEAGASYADGTLNIGSPGGKQDALDGIWCTMDPQPWAVLVPTEYMLRERQIDEQHVRLDFTVAPIGGSDVYTGGLLFNFCLLFDSAGTYTLGFEEFHDVKRTYFSDGTSREYYWSDISNQHEGITSTISVE